MNILHKNLIVSSGCMKKLLNFLRFFDDIGFNIDGDGGGNHLLVDKFAMISARCGGSNLGIVKRLCRAPAIAWLDWCAEPVVWS